MIIRFILVILLLLSYSSHTCAEWCKIAPLRNPSGKGRYLSDIISQCPDPSTYSDPDLVTTGHECTHGINSRIRQLAGPNTNGFYFCNRLGFIIKEPRHITLTQVANSIPSKYRGDVFDLYLVNSRQWWNDTPSYCFDEAIAYQAGTIVGIDLGLMERAEDSFFRALELNIYSIYATKLSKQNDMKELVQYLTAKNLIIYKKLPKNNPKVDRNYQMLLEVMRNN